MFTLVARHLRCTGDSSLPENYELKDGNIITVGDKCHDVTGVEGSSVAGQGNLSLRPSTSVSLAIAIESTLLLAVSNERHTPFCFCVNTPRSRSELPPSDYSGGVSLCHFRRQQLSWGVGLTRDFFARVPHSRQERLESRVDVIVYLSFPSPSGRMSRLGIGASTRSEPAAVITGLSVIAARSRLGSRARSCSRGSRSGCVAQWLIRGPVS